MGIVEIIFISIPSLMLIGWILTMIFCYILPNKSVKNGFSEWLHESDGDI